MMTFRFDDVCINSDMEAHNKMTDFLKTKFRNCEIIWAVSPGVIGNENQRTYPKRYNANSDFRYFYSLDNVSVPELRKDISIASHGLFHVDHRLLTREVQEVSIWSSIALINTKATVTYFVPPFNKYNKDTESICREQSVELIKWEGGWQSMEHNKFNTDKKLWYLHAREWTPEKLKSYTNGN